MIFEKKVKNNNRIEAVVFDVDGTLYPNYKMYIKSLIFFVQHPRISIAFSKTRRKIRIFGKINNFREKQTEILSQFLGISIEKGREFTNKLIYEQFVLMFKHIKPFPEVEAVLKRFKAAGIKLGVISDFPVKEKLSWLGLDKYWDEVLSADEIGCLKPLPDAFTLMAEKLNIAPEKIIYVGNHYLYDIIGSNNAGMRSAHFCRFKKQGSLADYTFYNYSKLGDFVLGSEKS